MTISGSYAPAVAQGNGTTTVFAVPFPFFAAADLVVTLFDTVAQAAVAPAPRLLGLGPYDYAVSGTQDPNLGEYTGGASLVFNTALPGNYQVKIGRSTPETQGTSLGPNAPFPAKAVEAALDRLTMIAQEAAAEAVPPTPVPPAADSVGALALDAWGSTSGPSAIMVTCFNEFGLDSTTQLGTDGNTFNGTLDQYVNGIAPASCVADFVHMVETDLAAMPGIQTTMLWLQWLSPTSAAGLDPLLVEPAINATVAGKVSAGQWAVGTYSSSSALQLSGNLGGTCSDASVLRGARLLAERGYAIGLAPVVIGYNSAGPVDFVWRGSFNWSTDAHAATFWANYQTFVQHYLDLFSGAGIPVGRVVIGSEFQALTISGDNAAWGSFQAAMRYLATYAKNAFPAAIVTYAANWGEYGVGGGFRLDGLWTAADIDEVGVDVYVPLATLHSNDLATLKAGLRAGEDMDWTVNANVAAQRALTTSGGNGKVGLAQTALAASAGSKNFAGFWNGNHYLSPQVGAIAEATPVPGYDRTYNPVGLGLMTGTGTPQVASTVSAPGTSGQHAPLDAFDAWMNFNGAQSATFTLPTWSGTQNLWEITLTWQLLAAPAAFARLFRVPNVVEVLCDVAGGNMVKLGFGSGGSEEYINLVAIDLNKHDVGIVLTGAGTSSPSATITVDGVPQVVALNSAAAVALGSASAAYVAGYDLSNNQAHVNIFSLTVTEIVNGTAYGGAFWFEEAYAGVRTAWTPRAKRLAACEVGFASMNGSAVEPNQFPYATFGSPVITLPAALDAVTAAMFEKAIAEGWNPTQIYGPYGSTFALDQVHQAAALKAVLDWMAASPMWATTTVYCLDCRPAAAMGATYLSGGTPTLFWQDGPLYQLGHQVNGKLAARLFTGEPVAEPPYLMQSAIPAGAFDGEQLLLLTSGVPGQAATGTVGNGIKLSSGVLSIEDSVQIGGYGDAVAFGLEPAGYPNPGFVVLSGGPTSQTYAALFGGGVYIGGQNIIPGGSAGRVLIERSYPGVADSESLTQLLDSNLGSAQGGIAFRNGSIWSELTASTPGYVLTTGGPGANPSWAVPGSGKQLLARSYVNAGNSGTGLTTVFTYTLAASKLLTVGQTIEIFAWGTLASNANTKLAEIEWGGSVLGSFTVTTGPGVWQIRARVTKTGSNTQAALAEMGTAFNNSSVADVLYQTTQSQTDTNPIAINVLVQGPTANNDVVLKYAEVLFVP